MFIICKRIRSATSQHAIQMTLEDRMIRTVPLQVSVHDSPFGGFQFERRMLPIMTFGKKATDNTVKVSRLEHNAIIESGPTNVYSKPF